MGGPATAIDVAITHDELASLCGMSRKTLSRILGDLKETGAIELSYGAVTILDLKLLGAIAAGDREIGPRIGFAHASSRPQ
jgi:DNA-binding IclR family transcriptional regulator